MGLFSKLRGSLSWLAGAPARRQAGKSAKYAFPERLLIYQDDTTRVALITLTNIFALSPFAFTAYYTWSQWRERPKLPALAACSVAFLPIPLVAISTRSFVMSIFLRLPSDARISTAALNDWLRRIPRTTQLYFQTPGGIIGGAVTRSFRIMDICPVRERWGRIANFSTFQSRNKLFAYGQHFYVRTGMEAGSDKVLTRNVWPKIAAMIEKPPKWD